METPGEDRGTLNGSDTNSEAIELNLLEMSGRGHSINCAEGCESCLIFIPNRIKDIANFTRKSLNIPFSQHSRKFYVFYRKRIGQIVKLHYFYYV